MGLNWVANWPALSNGDSCKLWGSPCSQIIHLLYVELLKKDGMNEEAVFEL